MTMVRYPGIWRLLHGLIAVFVLVLFVLGIVMVMRSEANLWDRVTDTLYAWHKAIGFAVLILMVLRLGLRLGCPKPPVPAMPLWQRWLSIAVHLSLYLLLFLVPLLGWAAVSAYPALNIFAHIALPALPSIPIDQARARELLDLHATSAFVLLAFITLHIAGVLKHRFIDHDGVDQRMSLRRQSDQ